jgi:hypothetical protein
MTFNPFTAAKLQQKVELTPVDTSISDIRRLAGLDNGVYDNAVHSRKGVQSHLAADLRRIERERNIKPGTQEWFRLWFAKPTLTGERPYDESQ